MRIGVRSLRGNADHALPHADLRADAGRAVAAAGHRVQALRGVASSISTIACAMPKSSRQRSRAWRSSSVSRSVARRQASLAAAQRGQQVRAAAAAAEHARARHLLDRHHFIHVGAEQLEHAGHAGVRRDAGQLGLHALEQRPFGLGAQVPQLAADTIAALIGSITSSVGARVGEDVLRASC